LVAVYLDVGDRVTSADKMLFADIVNSLSLVFHPEAHECTTGCCLSECATIQASFVNSTGFHAGVYNGYVGRHDTVQQSWCLGCPRCVDGSTITFASAKQILHKLDGTVTCELLTKHYEKLLADFQSSSCGACRNQLLNIELPLWGRNTSCAANHFYITDNVLAPLVCQHSDMERLSVTIRDPYALTLASVRPLHATSSHGCTCAIDHLSRLGDHLLAYYAPLSLPVRLPPAWISYIPSYDRLTEAHTLRLSPSFCQHDPVRMIVAVTVDLMFFFL